MKYKRIIWIPLCMLFMLLGVYGCVNNDYAAIVNEEYIEHEEVEAVLMVHEFNRELEYLFEENSENFLEQYQFAEDASELLLNKDSLMEIETEYLKHLKNREKEWDFETALEELLRIKVLLQEAENRNITLSEEQAIKSILSMTDFSMYNKDENLIRYIYDKAAQNVGYLNFEEFLKNNETVLVNEAMVAQFQQTVANDIFDITNLTYLEDTLLNRQIAWKMFENNLILNAEITINEQA
ncbi:MAG: hypothetical protein E7195_09010 [Peptococcaceae bacterium]|nr:hypothetical protein [Peptococcaceae bacterium]